ncbi:MAG: hypothetical protein WC869_14475 [Phycisphaerae bacterium]|jgi:hypothetical protein
MSKEPATGLKEHTSWQSFGIDADFLETKAAWLGEERELHGRASSFFAVAGSLIRFSRYDYKLASAAFFHAVLGLEKALKLHYRSDDGKLQELLAKALEDGLIADSLFGEAPAFTEPFGKMIRRQLGERPASRAELLVRLVPKLRNEYMHGEYLLAPDFLHFALQVRTIADQLDTRRQNI